MEAASSRAPSRPPGPRGRFLLGNLPDFASDVIGFFERCVAEHGDVVAVRLAGSEVLLLNRPRDVETILLTNRTNFIKHTFFWKHVTAIFGSGLLTSEGDFWLKQRRLAAPAFHPDRIAAYGTVMADRAERLADSWKDGETRDVHHDLMHTTMEIVAKTLFDAELQGDLEEVSRAFDMVIREIAARFRRPVKIPDWVPTPGNLRYSRGVARLDRLVTRILADRRAKPGDRGDLLSMLLAARDEEGNAMSDRQLRDEAVTIFLAGHETTAIALSWTFDLLSRNPSAEERLAAELAEKLDGRLPTVADLPKLQWTDAVVKEALRLYPPAYVIGREALADCEISGYPVRARTTVYFSPWVLHRDRRYFQRPAEFRPERWINGETANLPRYVYIPFGGGPRVCIGDRFALMEASLVLATIARRWRLERASPSPPVPFPSITLRPDGGVPMLLRRRVPAGGSRAAVNFTLQSS
jgi:cytochrome P450